MINKSDSVIPEVPAGKRMVDLETILATYIALYCCTHKFFASHIPHKSAVYQQIM